MVALEPLELAVQVRILASQPKFCSAKFWRPEAYPENIEEIFGMFRRGAAMLTTIRNRNYFGC